MKGRASREYVIWDPLVRCFHWSLPPVFSGIILLPGWRAAALDRIFCVFALAVRLVWGFIGPRHARFSDFWPSKAGILGHLQDLKKAYLAFRGTQPCRRADGPGSDDRNGLSGKLRAT